MLKASAAKAGASTAGKKAGMSMASRASDPAHPGFKAVAQKIAKQRGISVEQASRILAAKSRGASAAAKAANPRLMRVR